MASVIERARIVICREGKLSGDTEMCQIEMTTAEEGLRGEHDAILSRSRDEVTATATAWPGVRPPRAPCRARRAAGSARGVPDMAATAPFWAAIGRSADTGAPKRAVGYSSLRILQAG